MQLITHGLLAASDMASGLNQYLEDSASLAKHGWLIGGAIVVALAWILYPVFKRHQAARHTAAAKAAAPPPKSVFAELCDRHGLTADDRCLLKDAAQQSSVDSPSMLFVDPAPLHDLASSQPELSEHCESLVARLFAQPEPAGV